MSLQYLPFRQPSDSTCRTANNVLVVEDDSGDEFFIMRALRGLKLDANVVVARDGQEACDYLFSQDWKSSSSRSAGPTVIMLDLNLPKISGLELLAKIKAHEYLRTIPVVIMTSNESERDLSECYRLGANSVVQKGRFLEDFRESIGLTVTYWTRVNVKSA